MGVHRTLFHFPLDPASRQVRLALGERRIAVEEATVKYWEADPAFEALNPSGMTPVLVENGERERLVLCESQAIMGWIEDQASDSPLLGRPASERAEARRLVQWFDTKFNFEVNALLLHERMEKRLLGLGAPDGKTLRAGRDALRRHLTYMEGLLRDREWLAGRRMSIADFAAAGHLSVHDYFGEVPWDSAPQTRAWYAKLKSRPCFRPLLADRQPGMPPAAHYDDLDF